MDHPAAPSIQFSHSKPTICKLPNAKVVLNLNDDCSPLPKSNRGQRMMSRDKLQFLNTNKVLENVFANITVCAARQ